MSPDGILRSRCERSITGSVGWPPAEVEDGVIDGKASAPGPTPPGDVLRRERLRRRLSLIEVGQRTRIHPRLLDAIERDDVHGLPAPVFTVGLITSYAR